MPNDTLLSISIMTPGVKPTLEKCLASLDHLRQSISCELVIVDTGCDKSHRSIIDSYADKVVRFQWCDDFAAARNAGLSQCHGTWFLYLDDDEVLLNSDSLMQFLSSKESLNFDYADFELRDYIDWEETDYRVGQVTRLYRLHPDTQFIYPIHEGIPITPEQHSIMLPVAIGHYGYIFDTENERISHSNRNIILLERAFLHDPNNYHFACQLAQEYRTLERLEEQATLCRRFLDSSDASMHPIEQGILACGLANAYLSLQAYDSCTHAIDELCALSDLHNSVKTTLYCYGTLAAYRLENYQLVLNYGEKYLSNFRVLENSSDSYKYQLFIKHGFWKDYYSLVLQTMILASLLTRQDNLLLSYIDAINWEDEELKLHEDLPSVLCTLIEESHFTPALSQFLSRLLSVDSIKSSVLKYKLTQLQP